MSTKTPDPARAERLAAKLRENLRRRKAQARALTPDEAAPDGGMPDGATPDGATPDGGMPDGAVPDGAGESPAIQQPQGNGLSKSVPKS